MLKLSNVKPLGADPFVARKGENVLVPVSAELKSMIKQVADQQGRSMAAVCRSALDEYLADFDWAEEPAKKTRK